jgi:hypothetical protein
MSRHSKSDSKSEKAYIAKPLGDGSFRLEPEPDKGSSSGAFEIFIGAAIILLLLWWLFSTFFSNLFNLTVQRDFGWSQYLENISDFHDEDKCHFFAPPWWLDNEKYSVETAFLRELPPYPFTITTKGIKESEIKNFEEHESYIKSNFSPVLVDGRPPILMKYRGSREMPYQIEGDKFLPLDFEVTWSAISVYGSSESLHGYLLVDPDKLRSGSNSFEPGVEYELNTRDHRSLISYLNFESYFGDSNEKNDRYAVVFDDSCFALIKDRRQ